MSIHAIRVLVVILASLPWFVSCGERHDAAKDTSKVEGVTHHQILELTGTIEPVMSMPQMNAEGTLEMSLTFAMMAEGRPYELVEETSSIGAALRDVEDEAVYCVFGYIKGESEIQYNGIPATRLVVTQLRILKQGTGKKSVTVGF